MAGLSAADKAAILNAHLCGGTYTGEATLYIGLHTGDPGDWGVANELSYTSYERQPIAFLTADSTGTVNSTDVVFAVTDTEVGTVTHYSIHSAATGSAFRHSGLLTGGALDSGEIPTIKAGALAITI